MKALTIRHPWAELIAAGDKTVENRVQGTAYRGPLAIHVSTQWADLGVLDNHFVKKHATKVPDPQDPDLLATQGNIIAIVDLVDSHVATGDCCPEWGWWHDTRTDRLYRHLVLENVRRLRMPVPARGRLGLWPIDERNLRAAL